MGGGGGLCCPSQPRRCHFTKHIRASICHNVPLSHNDVSSFSSLLIHHFPLVFLNFHHFHHFDHVHPLLINNHITMPDQKRRKKAHVVIFVQVLQLGRHLSSCFCHHVPFSHHVFSSVSFFFIVFDVYHNHSHCFSRCFTIFHGFYDC